MRLTRKQLVATGAAAVVGGGGGIYALVDRLGAAPRRVSSRVLGSEQHVLEAEVVVDNGVEVVVPPLHHRVVTAKLTVGDSRAALHEAQGALEDALLGLERRFEPTPGGLGVIVAWGRPYFDRFVPGPAEAHLPIDLRASSAKGRRVQALIDAVRFPSDPHDVVLESNELAVVLRSDDRARIEQGAQAIFGDLHGLLEATSVRSGFAGGGFGGGPGLPKQMALAAGISGAELIPDGAELFLGFTSTQKTGLGPPRIANHETLPGYTDQWPHGYFRGGSSMHLSHIFEDLEAWYLNFNFPQRVGTMFRPGQEVAPGTQTVRQAPRDVASARLVKADARRLGAIGHSASIQTASRLVADVVGNDGTHYARGTAIPHRADFNTLDNPFTWSSRPDADAMTSEPAAGVHFVVFNPTSDDFHRNRLAMDGVLPDGTKLPVPQRDKQQGFNSVLKTTHRQNFLVPPRKHRSFPLLEFL
jgi:hypothetical protein